MKSAIAIDLVYVSDKDPGIGKVKRGKVSFISRMESKSLRKRA